MYDKLAAIPSKKLKNRKRVQFEGSNAFWILMHRPFLPNHKKEIIPTYFSLLKTAPVLFKENLPIGDPLGEVALTLCS